jgi:hypothetical protein
MRARRWIVAVCVVVVGLGAGGAAFASASADGSHESDSFTVLEHTTSVNLTHQPPGVGDRLLLQADLLETAHHHTVGVLDVNCVFGFANHALCDATATLEGRGQLVLVGEITDLFAASSFDIAITGGTNEFRGAEGQFHTVILSQTDARDTFLLNQAKD